MAWKQSKSNNGYSTGTLDCANNEHNDVGDFDSIAAWFKGPASLSILPLNCQGLKILSIEGCGASIKIDEIFDVENINLTVPLSLDIDEMICQKAQISHIGNPPPKINRALTGNAVCPKV